MNWYKKAQGFGDLVEEDYDMLDETFDDVFKGQAKEMKKLRKKRRLEEMQNFSVGKRVTKTMGCRMNGVVIPPFPWREADDGTFKEPEAGYIPVRWDDGTKGYEFKFHMEVILDD